MKYIILFSIFLSACKVSKDPVSTNTQDSTTNNSTTEGNPKESNILRVSFYSIGTGIQHNAVSGFKSIINDFEAQHKVTVEYRTKNWGREGEIDYCVDLNKMRKDLRPLFVNTTREKLDGYQVHIYENSVCGE